MDWIRIVQSAISYIEENISEEIDVDVLAEQHYVSSLYFLYRNR